MENKFQGKHVSGFKKWLPFLLYFAFAFLVVLQLLMILDALIFKFDEPGYMAPVILAAAAGTAFWTAWILRKRFSEKNEETPGPKQKFPLFRILPAVPLLLLFLPLGVLYLAWIFKWKPGLRTGCGCASLSFSLIFTFIVLVIISNANPGIYHNVSRQQLPKHLQSALPEDARNISFYRTYSWTAFECDCSEAAVRKWASGKTLKEIEAPVTAARWNAVILEEKYDCRRPDPDLKRLEAFRKSLGHEVRHGLAASLRQANGGGFSLVYDRDAGRLYWQTNPR